MDFDFDLGICMLVFMQLSGEIDFLSFFFLPGSFIDLILTESVQLSYILFSFPSFFLST